MNNSSLEYLLRAYVNKTCTLAEEDELMQLILDPRNEMLIKDILDDLYDHRLQKHHLSATESREMIREILMHADKEGGSRNIRIANKWKYIAAAAAVVIFALTFSLSLLRNMNVADDLAEEQTITYTEDVTPGGNVAFLTLDNDSVITLDHVEPGSVIQQRYAHVIKSDEGELVYQEDIPATDNNIVVEYHTLTTPRGGQFKLVLPDGSRVWLNAESSIRFPSAFAAGERRVEVKGEAYFEVAHQPERPFFVLMNDHPVFPEGAEIEVLGTHFNVMAYADEQRIAATLVEGSVRFGRLHDACEKAILKPGQQAVALADKDLKINEVNLFEVTAWKDGYFVFNDEDIESIMRKLARWYNVDVAYTGELTYREFSGMISRYENISKALEKFELTGAISFDVKDNTITVKP